MVLCTIGFTKKSAATFFETLKKHEIDLLIDIRLNNSSQLAGFSKGDDLKYFLQEICRCEYVHDMVFTPAKEIFDGFQSKNICWNEFETRYKELLKERSATSHFVSDYSKYKAVCLLCSEATPDHCHRRLLAELLKESNDEIQVVHI